MLIKLEPRWGSGVGPSRYPALHAGLIIGDPVGIRRYDAIDDAGHSQPPRFQTCASP
jgi:hypothetical protein